MIFFLYLCTQMRKILFIVSLLMLSMRLWSVPATREPVVRILADGSTDTVYLHGDEYYHYYTDRFGRVIEGTEYRDQSLSAEAEGIRTRAPQKKMLYSYVPSSGKVRIPVILVNFSDLSFTIPNAQAQFDDLFNGAGGSNPNATGSVRDYYTASSNSAIDLEYEVFGPYTLPRDMEYYGQNKTSGYYTDHNLHARELVIDAVNLAANAGVDFSRYDANGDGYVDNVSIVVAGYNEAEGGAANTIWPHYSLISNSTTQYNGKYIGGYLMISEYRSSGGKVQAGIGTYCHEFGHALGLPDLYDTENGENYTVGDWDIMCSGSYNNNGSTPPTYTAFERFMMGWLVPEQILSSGMRVLEPIEISNRAFLIAAKTHNLNAMSPSPAEYFLLENRQRVGWDGGDEGALVAPGLLISHITFNQATWNYNTFNNNKPLGFAIVSAGSENPSYSTGLDVFPGLSKRTSWTPVLNSGNQLDDYVLTQIRQREDLNVTMQVGVVPGEALVFDQDMLEVETSYLNAPITYDTARVNLIVPATKHEGLRMYLSADRFRFSAAGGNTWLGYRDTLEFAMIQDSAYVIPIEVVYLPVRKNCNYELAYLTAETSDGEMGIQLALAGRAPRPTYITTPEIDTVLNVTATSFVLRWKEQDDVDWYDFTLYSISEGATTEEENFESFDSMDSIQTHGWEANFTNTTIQGSRALLFDHTGYYIQTPMYVLPPAAVVMRLNNNYTPSTAGGDAGGELLLEGSIDGENWELVNRKAILRTTRNVDWREEVNGIWRQFRLSYSHTAGEGGVIVDDWQAILNKEVHYVYRLRDREVGGSGNELLFRDLQPGTTYYYSMRACETKGCEPHMTPLSEPVEIRTKDTNGKLSIKAVRTGEGQFTILLTEPADGNHYIGVYNYLGEQICRLRPGLGTTEMTLPALPLGQLYMVKYYSGSMKRKDMNTKLLSY